MEKVEKSDYIFAMSQGHCDALAETSPAAAKKCMLLDAGRDIADPIGRGLDVYRLCAEQIEKAVKKRTRDLL